MAVDYEEQLRESLAASPHDRAVLGLFAELVTGRVPRRGLRTGPRITRHLADLGVDVAGVDLSPGMVGVARSRHPGLDFSVGQLSDLALPDAALGGVVAWYSVIHTPPSSRSRCSRSCAACCGPVGCCCSRSRWGRSGAASSVLGRCRTPRGTVSPQRLDQLVQPRGPLGPDPGPALDGEPVRHVLDAPAAPRGPPR